MSPGSKFLGTLAVVLSIFIVYRASPCGAALMAIGLLILIYLAAKSSR